MKKINCLVADDEQLAREVMQSHISKLDKLNLVGTCNNAIEVYNTLKDQNIDLLFLDIQMPQLTGIELLRTLKNPPPVILTTAHREFALEGYELNVIDYLLKPVSFERFLKAVDKYETASNADTVVVAAAIPPPAVKDDRLAFIYVKSDKKMVRILLSDILYIEGLKDYVKIYTTGNPVITYQTLTYLEEKLSANHFIRAHRSYIISLNHISAYSSNQIEIGKRIIPIGNSYAKDVLKKLEG